MPPSTISSSLPVGGYTEKNHADADLYSRTKLIQQQICSLVASEPLTYSFVNIENKGIEGWKSLGIEIERGQALAPFYNITYDTDKLDCSRFSCIPIDIRNNNNNNNGVKHCIYDKTPVIDVKFGLSDNDTFTACGESCYNYHKTIDPHTGLPKAGGNLMKKGSDGLCHYINQSLLLWGTVPISRTTQSGDIMTGYNDKFVPPFKVVDNGMYNNLEITNAYCQYFKRWFDPTKKECYRTTWMKFFHFSFGTAISNIFFPQDSNLIEQTRSKLNTRKLDLRHANVEKILGVPPIERLTKNEMNENMVEKIYNDHYDNEGNPLSLASLVTHSFLHNNEKEYDFNNNNNNNNNNTTTITNNNNNTTSTNNNNNTTSTNNNNNNNNNNDNNNNNTKLSSFLPQQLSQKELLYNEILTFIKNKNHQKNVNTGEMENLAEDIMEKLLDVAIQCKIHKLSDAEVRKIFLSKILRMNNKKNIKFSEYLQIFSLYNKIKGILFSDIKYSTDYIHHHNQELGHYHHNSLFKNDADLTMFIEDRYGFNHKSEQMSNPPEKRPAYIVKLVKSLVDSSNSKNKYEGLQNAISFLYHISPEVQDKLKNFAFKLWTDLHDLLSPKWERYNDDFSFSSNFFVLLMVDNAIQQSLSLMSKSCTKILQKITTDTIERLASRAALMTEDFLVSVFSRFVISSAERFAINYLIRGSVVLALQIFAKLVALAAGILDGIGILFLVAGILGLILDLALNMAWYDNVMTPKNLADHVNNYVKIFKSATNLTTGETAPVTPRELVEIAISSEVEGLNNETYNDDDDDDDNDDNDGNNNNNNNNKKEDKGQQQTHISYVEFLDKYFGEKPLIESKTDIFLQEAYFEYLGTKTMNSLGQPLGRNNNNNNKNQNLVSTYLDGGKKKLMKLLNIGSEYADVVSYNAPRVMVYELDKREDKKHYKNLENISKLQVISNLSVLGATLSVIIGCILLVYSYSQLWFINIFTFIFLISLIVYMFLLSISYSAVIMAKENVKNFIFYSRLFNLDEVEIMNHKDVESLKENATSVRFFFSEFTKPFMNFLAQE
uniref:Wsv115-like protein n=1 Tax=Metapenaeus joyneri majanivirus TaxID=2984280 RepID=A0A9C7C8T9_9VIRU|nr:MAG: wsv115-like protein [Metapenaeus joyneri majanivirus]